MDPGGVRRRGKSGVNETFFYLVFFFIFFAQEGGPTGEAIPKLERVNQNHNFFDGNRSTKIM